MIIKVDLANAPYDVHIDRGLLRQAGELFDLDRRVLIVTDDGVPARYAETVASCCRAPVVVTIPAGEASKNLQSFEMLLKTMLANGFTRRDCVAAVGGGVVGDLAGFTAACYMRGVDFYNVPTTVLSQVDSSVGGKTAVDLAGIKNAVGAFHQPRGVLIDPEVLATLPPRQISNGLAEALKMAVTFDEDLLRVFETEDVHGSPGAVIAPALAIKRNVVEADEREKGLRRVLNFGHTIGHGIESGFAENGLLHGECVALGMLPMCAPDLRERVKNVLLRLRLPVKTVFDPDRVIAALAHDKKAGKGAISAIFSEKAGSYSERRLTPEEFRPLLELILEGGETA